MVGAVLERETTLRIGAATTLVSDGTADMVTNRVNGVAGCSVDAASTAVTANSTQGMRAGDLVAITDAGPEFDGDRKVHYAEIVSIDSATTLTIDTPAEATVSGVTLTYGVSGCSVEGGGTLDGNKAVADQSPNYFPVRWWLGRDCHVDGLTIRDSDHGAVMLFGGCRDCTVTGNTLTDNGRLSDSLGAHVWVFGGGVGNTISGNTISGEHYGVVLDDRSTSDDEYDATTTGCTVSGNTITNVDIGIVVEGSSTNTIDNNTIDTADEGVVVRTSTQGISEFRAAEDNSVTDNDISSCRIGLRMDGVNTTQSGNTFTDCTTDVDDNEA